MSNASHDRELVLLGEVDGAVPGDPWSHLRFHYGQLLGEQDFTSEQRTRVLRHRLHLALFHGSGTAFGLEIRSASGGAQIKVCPGLAVDAAGREIFVDKEQCLDVQGLHAKKGFWAKLKEVERPRTAGGDDVARAEVRRAYVVLTYNACLGERIPAISQPCSGEDDAWTFGRLFDRYAIRLVEARPPDPLDLQREWIEAGRRNGPRDEWSTLRDELLAFLMDPSCDADDPHREPHGHHLDKLGRLWQRFQEAPVLLGSVDLAHFGTAEEGKTQVYDIDNSIRPLLPGVQTLGEEVLGQRLIGDDLREPIKVKSIELELVPETANSIVRGTIELTRSPHADTVNTKSVRLYRLEGGGWNDIAIDPPTIVDQTRIVFDTRRDAGPWTGDQPYQIVVVGGSDFPILADHTAPEAGRPAPLAGWWNEPVPDHGRGRDVSHVSTLNIDSGERA